jgi:hypothetical protein
MQMQELVDRIAQRLNIDAASAEKAAGTILSIIEQEGQGNKVGQLFAKLPGAQELARQYSVSGDASAPASGLGGVLSGIVSGVMGGKAQALLAGMNQLRSTGLSTAQIEGAGAEIFAYAKDNAGPQLVSQVVASVPGLSAYLPKAA